eukprot:TRINITY_DN31202_c0_g1_i1.p1 TRINITY_DN31202_c0_g1~~TRINITY_DN31202_c0_g1_i1.p1  ORF type:complete len:119 (+),score=27.85 TRINITY_DN31202_c0_g1_i1:43-399(+)
MQETELRRNNTMQAPKAFSVAPTMLSMPRTAQWQGMSGCTPLLSHFHAKSESGAAPKTETKTLHENPSSNPFKLAQSGGYRKSSEQGVVAGAVPARQPLQPAWAVQAAAAARRAQESG